MKGGPRCVVRIGGYIKVVGECVSLSWCSPPLATLVHRSLHPRIHKLIVDSACTVQPSRTTEPFAPPTSALPVSP